MSVVLHFEVCDSRDCKSLLFTETTGAYNVTSNPTGWGAPNELTSDAVSAVLNIVLPSSTSVNINLFTSSYPSVNKTLEYTITSATLGLAANLKLDDGLYVFTYTVVTGTTTYTQVNRVYITCNSKCCVATMLAKIPDKDCNCNDEYICKVLKAYTFYQALVLAGETGQTTKFANLKEILDDMCLSTNCGCN